jgi:hypothetical protein
MADELGKLHDATLLAVHFDWSSRTCTLTLSGGPELPGDFIASLQDVSMLSVPAVHPWGESVSILEAAEGSAGRFEFAMQSGDTITVVAPNISFQRTRYARR